MTIGAAIQAAADQAGWSTTKIAAETDVSVTTAKRWVDDVSVPSGAALETLRAKLHGLAELLDARQQSAA
jgi:DNA-binding transcriptional regulator YiaG